MTYKNLTLSIVSIATLFLAVWTTYFSYHSQNAPVKQIKRIPDAFMEEVSAVIMDKYGKPKMKIKSPKLVHYLENDTTHLTSPALTLFHKSSQPWYVTSKYAKATNGVDNIDFREDVTIHHAADEHIPATIIKAPTLIVHPNNETAETNEEIVLIQPNITVKSIGMRANIKTGNIKLLSQARGEYVPDTQ